MKHNILFAGNLTFELTEAELKAAFLPFGDVIEARIIRRFDNDASRGFGFVEMADEDAAAKALAGMNGKDLAGRVLKVGWARVGPARQRTAYLGRPKI
jgi:RNA recognition motif-containing protein